MKYTAAHWGAYRFEPGSRTVEPLPDDPAPARIGKGWVSATQDRNTRILSPCVRKGYLAGDGGKGRGTDSYVPVSWDQALDLAAEALTRVREESGNGAIYGGSYGWSSAGRFHHAQSQMRRFLALAGGYVSSRDTYSHAAAEVLYPYIIGLSNRAFQDQMTALPLVAEHCDLLIAFGGISRRTAQIASSGTSRHEVDPWIANLTQSGVEVITVSPERGDLPGDWLAIRPGTDTALMLALMGEIELAGRSQTAFLEGYTSGWPQLRAYLLGEQDGVPKTADWAEPITGIPAETIRALATKLPERRSMISLAWSLQRADHGEQPLWAGLALASQLGQIGEPGTGYAFGYGSTTPVGRASRLIPWPSFPVPKNPVNEFIPVARITDMLEKPGSQYTYDGQNRTYPHIDLIWWTGGNPFHHHQDLKRLEDAWRRPSTVIVNDHSWTASARRADIVMPATTPLERDDIMMNRRDPALIYMSAMFTPLGKARDDHAIFAALAKRLGFGDTFTLGRDTQDWLSVLWQQAGEVAKNQGFSLPDFDAFKQMGRFDIPDEHETRIALKAFREDPQANPLGTETGKITLFNQTIADMALPDCPGYPTWIAPVEGSPVEGNTFHLISGQPDSRLHSQNDAGEESRSSKHRGRERCRLHPVAAQQLGVVEGDILLLSNDRGATLAAVTLHDGIREDCISLPTGAWYDPQMVGQDWLEVHGNPNAVTLDKGCSGLSQGNIAHTCIVKAERWDKPLPEIRAHQAPVRVQDEPQS
jgi:biotin/methionine sulfoxide reductase